MKLLFDLFPIVLFFAAYKFYDLFVATGVAMVAVIVQMVVLWCRRKKPDMMNWIAFGMILILGGATLFFRNEMFIKWKPTAVYGILGLIFLGSHWFTPKLVVQRLMEGHMSLSKKMWTVLNIAWVAFFFTMGILNLIVVYCCDTSTWVNFKLFGTTILTFGFLIGQAIWLSRNIPAEEQAKNQ
jgi:intracellular septation protein